MKSIFAHIIFFTVCISSYAQVINIKKYFDKDSVHIKESFFVLKNKPNILDSTYISYYFNGNKKREGIYKDNKAVGDWMFFYEGESIKMIGPLSNNQSNGYWKYFFENGNIRKEGLLVNNKKSGLWKYYHENGKVKSKGQYKNDLKNGSWSYNFESGRFKAQAEYKNGKGEYYEFYDDGIIKMKGAIENEKSNGSWSYHYPNGGIESNGEERNGLKEGDWKFYYPDGETKSEGAFDKGKSTGDWKYFHQNGVLKAQGQKFNDNKTGYWKVMFETGSLQSEANYDNTETGIYTEYYPSGKLKISGQYEDGKHSHLWKYYYEKGELEGVCNYDRGIGYYKGYTIDNKLKIEGKLRGSEKIGTWTLYDRNGEVAGYYHTYDNEEHPVFSAVVEKKNTLPSGHMHSKAKSVNWKKFQKSKFAQAFRSHKPAMDAFIFGLEPLSPVLGKFSANYEYWVNKKYGHDFIATYVRLPTLRDHSDLALDKIAKEGLSLAYKFKFYNESKLSGYVHFDSEFRFCQNKYSTTVLTSKNTTLGLTSVENLFEYSFLFGNRYVLSRDQKIKRYIGWTIDAYLGLGIGYRSFNDSWNNVAEYDNLYSPIKGSAITVPLRLGFNIGYSF